MTVSVMERRQVLDQLSRVATDDVVKLWRAAEGLPSSEFRALMVEGFPEIVNPHASAAGELSADWYEASAPEFPYRATVGELPNPDALTRSADWAMGANGDAALSRLAGTLQRAIWMTSRDTIVGNVKAERGSVWVRSVSADACSFCAMLATRGAVYASADTAMKSSGASGNSRAGSKYHDHCRCQATEVRPGKYWEPPSYVERYEQAYIDARNTAGGDTKAILAEMRQLLGSH